MAYELVTASDLHTSIFEKAQLTSSDSFASNLVWRLMNESYVDISQLHLWRWLQKAGSTIVPKVYATGAITVANNAATVVGSSVAFTASMVGRKIYFDSENDLYQINSVSTATRLLLTASYRGTAIASGAFRIFQDSYTLASDCEELLDVYHYRPGARRAHVLRPVTQRQMLDTKMSTYFVDGPANVYSSDINTTAGLRKVSIWPAADTTRDYRLRYEYTQRITSLSTATQQPLMPVTYRSAIMWGALADLFMREGATERMRWAQAKKQEKINEMRKDWEVTDRRPMLRMINTFSPRRRKPSPARFDLGKAFDDDTFDW